MPVCLAGAFMSHACSRLILFLCFYLQDGPKSDTFWYFSFPSRYMHHMCNFRLAVLTHHILLNDAILRLLM